MKVCSLNISDKKGVLKKPVEEALFIEGKGIEGDAHKGGERQVSLLAKEDIDSFQEEKGVRIDPGMFAENVTTEGWDLGSLKAGDRIMVGESELEITHIGKLCHEDCKIKELTGDCIMPTKGMFAKVLKTGRVRKGDKISQV